MADIVRFSGITKLDLPPERNLQDAIDHGMSTVLVIGWDKTGDFFFSSSTADGGDVLWLMALAQKKLLEVC